MLQTAYVMICICIEGVPRGRARFYTWGSEATCMYMSQPVSMGDLVVKRLEASQRLQQNPADVEAQKLLAYVEHQVPLASTCTLQHSKFYVVCTYMYRRQCGQEHRLNQVSTQERNSSMLWQKKITKLVSKPGLERYIHVHNVIKKILSLCDLPYIVGYVSWFGSSSEWIWNENDEENGVEWGSAARSNGQGGHRAHPYECEGRQSRLVRLTVTFNMCTYMHFCVQLLYMEMHI